MVVFVLAIAGCGSESESERAKVIEEGDAAGRWASAAYSTVMFAVHCEKDTATRRTLSSRVDWFEQQAALPGLDEYDRVELEKAADALSCEPDLANRLRAAIPQ